MDGNFFCGWLMKDLRNTLIAPKNASSEAVKFMCLSVK